MLENTHFSSVLEENENSLNKRYIWFNQAILWHPCFWQKVVIGLAIE